MRVKYKILFFVCIPVVLNAGKTDYELFIITEGDDSIEFKVFNPQGSLLAAGGARKDGEPVGVNIHTSHESKKCNQYKQKAVLKPDNLVRVHGTDFVDNNNLLIGGSTNFKYTDNSWHICFDSYSNKQKTLSNQQESDDKNCLLSLWDLSSEEMLYCHKVPFFVGIKAQKSGKLFATGGCDSPVKIYDIERGDEIGEVGSLKDNVILGFNEHYENHLFVFDTINDKIGLCDLDTYKVSKCLEDYFSPVICQEISKIALCKIEPNKHGLYSVATITFDFNVLAESSGLSESPLYSLSFSRDGKMIACCNQNEVLLLDSSSLEWKKRFTEKGLIQGVGFTPDDNLFVNMIKNGDGQQSLRIYDKDTLENIFSESEEDSEIKLKSSKPVYHPQRNDMLFEGILEESLTVLSVREENKSNCLVQ